MLKKFLLSLLLIILAATAFAQVHGTKAEAIAMIEKATAYIKSAGPDKAFAEFTDKENRTWHNKDLYVFVVKWDGNTVAHGGSKGLVGKSVMEMKDSDGVFFIKKMLVQAKNKGSGWVDYKWANPQTKEIDSKSTYVTQIPGYGGFIGVGIYK